MLVTMKTSIRPIVSVQFVIDVPAGAEHPEENGSESDEDVDGDRQRETRQPSGR